MVLLTYSACRETATLIADGVVATRAPHAGPAGPGLGLPPNAWGPVRGKETGPCAACPEETCCAPGQPAPSSVDLAPDRELEGKGARGPVCTRPRWSPGAHLAEAGSWSRSGLSCQTLACSEI